MKRTLSAALAAFLLCAPALRAHDYKIGGLVIGHPMAFETARTAMTGGGYLTITNTGETADTLIAVRADFPKVMLHTTEDDNGIARMMHVDAIEIPAGGTVALEPGGLHVMFMGLRGNPFEAGQSFPATLVFENAGEIEVDFNIEARGSGAAEPMDHSGHDATN